MKFSIITVCYNNRDGLEKTIKSVICQTYNDYEFIVIDGGSKDGTKELLEQYNDKIDFWCSEPDNGIYNAMNKGVKHTRGEYVIFMNSGDIFYDSKVLENIAKINTDAEIITGNVNSMDDNTPLRYHHESMFEQLYHDTLNHQGTFVKRQLLIDYPYEETNLKIVSDWKFWIDAIILHNASFYRTDITVAAQDMTGISQDTARVKNEREIVYDQFLPPLLRDEIRAYYNLQKHPMLKNSLYIQEKMPWLYAIIRKSVTLIYKMLKKFYQEPC